MLKVGNPNQHHTTDAFNISLYWCCKKKAERAGIGKNIPNRHPPPPTPSPLHYRFAQNDIYQLEIWPCNI